MRDLAPTIHRQRMVIEGHVDEPITAHRIEDYLTSLSDALGMTTLLPPVTHLSGRYGWAGWIRWETSGAHFYAWDVPRPFFSVDICTGREFDPIRAAAFTAEFLSATDIEFEEFPASASHPYLRHSDIKALTELFLDVQARPDRYQRPFGTYLIDGRSAFADLGRFVELEVYSEFFGNDSAEMSNEYDPFDPVSTHVVIIDHNARMPAGSTRLIAHSAQGFKSVADMAARPEWSVAVGDIESFHGVHLDPATTLDQATIAVRRDYRAGVVSPALFHGLYMFCLGEGIENVLGIGDVNYIELCWALGTPLEVICDLPALSHLDSPLSRPFLIRVGVLRALVRNPESNPMAEILRGRGVSGSVSLPPLLLADGRLGREVELVRVGASALETPARASAPAARAQWAAARPLPSPPTPLPDRRPISGTAPALSGTADVRPEKQDRSAGALQDLERLAGAVRRSPGPHRRGLGGSYLLRLQRRRRQSQGTQ